MRNKYRNQKVCYGGIKFDSKGERDRFVELQVLQKRGLIFDLDVQYKIELVPSFKYKGKTIRALSYIADYKYFDKAIGKTVLEDFKGCETGVFKLKHKLILYMIYMNKFDFEFIVTKKQR